MKNNNMEYILLEEALEEIYYGITAKKTEKNTGLKMLRTTDIFNYKFNYDNLPYCEITERQKEIKKFLLKKGDIIIARAGTVGISIIVDKDYNNVVFGSYLIKIKLKDNIYPKFFYYFLQSDLFWKNIIKSQGSTLKNINLPFLRKIYIPKFYFSEQQKIAEILSTVDEGIEVCDKKIEKLERYKKGMMQKLLTKGIGHTKFKNTEIGEIPEGWEVVKVKNLFEKAKNKRIIGIKTKEYLKEGKFPIIDQSNKFISGYTNDENRVYKGDLPIIIFGDHTKIFKFLDFPFALGADGTKILILKKNYNIKYIYYILNFIKFQNEGYRRHIDILREKVIAISSNSIEQQKIAEVLSTIDELIELEKQRKKKFERYKKGLMNDLLTGRKRVKIN